MNFRSELIQKSFFAYAILLGLAMIVISCGNIEQPAEETPTKAPAVEAVEDVNEPEENEETTETEEEEIKASEEMATEIEPIEESATTPRERPHPQRHEREEPTSASNMQRDRIRTDEVWSIERNPRDGSRNNELRPATPQSGGQGQHTTQSREIESAVEANGRVQVLPIETPEEAVVTEEPPKSPSTLEKYSVLLELDSVIKHPGNGELIVWIGLEDMPEKRTEGVTRDKTTIPASIGQYATVKPIAPNFEIDPPVKQCIRIHPNGSEVKFILTPKDSGTFRVSAQILLYDSINCNGPPVPRTASTLSVKVHVESESPFRVKMAQLGEVLWDNFLKFWGALLAILFGFAIYKIRKKLKMDTKGNDARRS